MSEQPSWEREIERWFVAQGVPHFIDGFDPRQDTFTRVLPLLLVVFLLQVPAEAAFAGSWPRRAVALGAAVAVFLVAAIIVGRLRHQPWLRRPKRVGAPEVAIFVLTGPAAMLAAGAGLAAAGMAVLVNVTLSAAVLLMAMWSLDSVLAWVTRRTVRKFGQLGALAARGLPMLVVFTVLTFFSSDLWHVADGMGDLRLLAVVGAFMVLGTLFLWVRLPDELQRIPDKFTELEVREALACAQRDIFRARPSGQRPGMPPLDSLIDEAMPLVVQPGLTKAHKLNMRVFLLLCQAIQVGLLTVLVWVFFLSFGRLAVTDQVLAGWFGAPPQYPGHMLGIRVPGLSTQLLDTSALLAIFAGVYFTVSAVADSDYRKEFFDATFTELIAAVRVRCGYLTLRKHSAGGRQLPGHSAHEPVR